MRALISVGLAAALGAATLVATPQIAAAGSNWDPHPGWSWNHRPHHHHRHNNGGAFVAGTFLGLALGGLANPGYRYVQPYPAYGGSGWNAHVAWCSSKFRSYNPSTNLYLTYHNGWQPCHSPYGW